MAQMSGECMCVWESGCNGLGAVRCRGCGGDLCICRCGGERDCNGCDGCAGAAAADEIFADEVADALEQAGFDVVRRVRVP